MDNPPHSRSKLNWGAIFGFAVVGIYMFCTGIAIALYPDPVSPLTTYLSMIGNARLNPDGSAFFNAGMITSSFVEFLFIVRLYFQYSHDSRIWFLRIGTLSGIFNALALLMTGVYAQHIDMDVHITWSYLIFYSLIPLLVAYSLALWGKTKRLTAVSVFGCIVCLVDFFFLARIIRHGLGSGVGPVLEWATVFAYMTWVCLMSWSLSKIRR